MCISTSSCVLESVLRRAGVSFVLALSCVWAGASASWTASRLEPLSTASWQVLGEAEMRWLGFRLYDAALWVPSGQAWSSSAPFALEIRYARAIKSQRLVDASLDEMERLGLASAKQRLAWRPLLAAAFPDVEPDDVIVGMRDARGHVSFFHRGLPTAVIDDPAFAAAFFAIWLDERTREPAMRARLLGDSSAR